MKFKTSWQTKFLAALLAVGLLPFFTIVILALIPLDPLTINSVTIVNSQKMVVAGEKLHYIVDTDKHIQKPAKITRQLINERTIYYTSVDSNLPRGASIRGESLGTSSADMPGIYHLRMTYTYRYFYFRDVSVVADSDIFMIVGKK